MTLDQIAIKHGTDKATVHEKSNPHGYAPYYEQVFEQFRWHSIKLLEIGVGGGESIRTWLEYFPQAKVYGVDVVHGTNPWNTVKAETDARYTFVTGDQSCEVFWKCFIADYGKDWAIVVDDGGHTSGQVITTFKSLWPVMAPGGVYCIEDLAVGYGAGSVFATPGFPRHMEFIKSKLDEINLEDEIASMLFSKELAILRKR